MSLEKLPIIVSERDWRDLIGIQFALGGSNPAMGLNCYGLVREVYRGLQIELPEVQAVAADAATITECAGNDWTRLNEPKPYAVALIRSEGNGSKFHVGVVTPELTLLHSLPKKGVVVSPLRGYAHATLGFYWYTPGEGEALPAADGTAGRMIGIIVLAALTIATAGGTSGALAASGGVWATAAGGASTWALAAGGAAAAMVAMAGNMIINAELPSKPVLEV